MTIHTVSVADFRFLVEPHTDGAERRCDPSELRETEVPSLSDEPTAKIDGIDTERVVRSISHGVVRLRRRLR